LPGLIFSAPVFDDDAGKRPTGMVRGASRRNDAMAIGAFAKRP